MDRPRFSLSMLFVFLWLPMTGCSEVSEITGSTWHQKCGWKAEDYFNDPQVIALCKAIEANDLSEMDRLIAAGANVNAKGKDNMTPLMWAFPDNKLDRFKKLLEHGADPNVAIKSDLNTRGGFGVGDCVTHMACATTFPGYFEAVFEHGGDVNLVSDCKSRVGNTPIFSVIDGGGPNKKEHVRQLLAKGADINYLNGANQTPVMEAVGWGAQYDIALLLLNLGADYKIYMPKTNQRLIHIVVGEEYRKPTLSPQKAADYAGLIKWLEEHGESVDIAKADLKRWQSYHIGGTAEYRRKIDAEIAEREVREAAENKASAETLDQKK